MATQRGSEAFQLADLDVEVTTPANTRYVGTAKAFSPGERSLSLTRPVSSAGPSSARNDFITEGQELEIGFSLLMRGKMRPFQLRARVMRSESNDLTVQFVDPDLAALVALQELVTRAENASARTARGERVPAEPEIVEAPLSSHISDIDCRSTSSDNVIPLQDASTERPTKDPGAISSDDGHPPEEPDLEDTQGGTVVGRNLAELIEEIHEDHRELKDDRSRGDGPDEVPAAEQLETDTARRELDRQIKHIISSDAEELEAELRESARAAGTAVQPEESTAERAARGAPGHPLSDITHMIDAELRRYLKESVAAQRKLLEQRMNAAVAQLKHLATERMRKNAEKIRTACHAAYAAKEARLQQRYETLMSLAEKIRRQKAEIHEARTELEEKLAAANELHHQVSRIGETVSRQVDDLEGMVGDEEP